MAAHQDPPSLGFSRQEHWSGLPFPSPMCEREVTQLCLTLRDPMDCSTPGSSVHGIFQARVLEWVAIAFSPIFLWLYAKYILYLVFSLTTHFPLYKLNIWKKATELPDSITGLLTPAYECLWNCKKKKIEILVPLLLITDSWLWALILQKALFSPWRERVQFLRHKPTVFPSLPAEN